MGSSFSAIGVMSLKFTSVIIDLCIVEAGLQILRYGYGDNIP